MDTLAQLLENAGFETRSYSGRGMYGKQCLAVEAGSSLDVFSAVLEGVSWSDTPKEDADTLAKAFKRARTDSLGLGVVVYFPNIPYDKVNEDTDEDND